MRQLWANEVNREAATAINTKLSEKLKFMKISSLSLRLELRQIRLCYVDHFTSKLVIHFRYFQ